MKYDAEVKISLKKKGMLNPEAMQQYKGLWLYSIIKSNNNSHSRYYQVFN